MFKIGDKVRCKPGQPSYVPKTGTVAGCDGSYVYFNGYGTGYFVERFEPVPPEPTDAELAEAYRASSAEALRLFNKLTDRGYKIEGQVANGVWRPLIMSLTSDRRIFKTETKRVEL